MLPDERAFRADIAGAAFRLGVAVTCAAMSVLALWLAGVITNHGIGSGLWVLVISATVAALPQLTAMTYELASWGVISPGQWITPLLIALLGLA